MSSMNLGEGNNSIDVVEKFLRMLIVRNELSGKKHNRSFR